MDGPQERADAAIRAVAHDLRGPLGVIRGFVELLRDHGEQIDDDVKRHALERIDATAARLLRLVDDVLDLGRTDAEPLARMPVRVDEAIALAIDAVDAGGRIVERDLAAVTASLDSVALGRIVEHLVENALRHTPDGTPLRVSVEERDGGIVVSVEDRGPGVPDDEKAAIFEPFRRGSRTRVGTGVGLAVVTRHAQRHGGRAWVEDRAGGGASFRVSLPRPTE